MTTARGPRESAHVERLDGQDGGDDYYRGIGWYRRRVILRRGGRRLPGFDGANRRRGLFVTAASWGATWRLRAFASMSRRRDPAAQRARPRVSNA
jgi:hypothetical protein